MYSPAYDYMEVKMPEQTGYYVRGEHTIISWHRTRGEAELEAHRLERRGINAVLVPAYVL